jgi:acyl-[acyl-carrier-protein] desaturase
LLANLPELSTERVSCPRKITKNLAFNRFRHLSVEIIEEKNDVQTAIAGEEALHEKAYKFFMGKIFESDPNGGLAAFVAMMKKKIVMPANLMDFGTDKTNYLNYVNITQKIGVYTSFDYAGIIDHLVKHWGIDQLLGLSDEGNKAQDFLSTLAERYYKLAERMQEPREMELVWLNK